VLLQESNFVWEAVKATDERGPSMSERHIARLLIYSTIEVINLSAIQETNSKPSNFIGRSVVDLEFLSAASYIDSALAQ
jgi:hypothetical protein